MRKGIGSTKDSKKEKVSDNLSEGIDIEQINNAYQLEPFSNKESSTSKKEENSPKKKQPPEKKQAQKQNHVTDTKIQGREAFHSEIPFMAENSKKHNKNEIRDKCSYDGFTDIAREKKTDHSPKKKVGNEHRYTKKKYYHSYKNTYGKPKDSIQSKEAYEKPDENFSKTEDLGQDQGCFAFSDKDPTFGESKKTSFITSQKLESLQKKSEKVGKRLEKAKVRFLYQKYLEENPDIQKKSIQKWRQKQRIKREYTKAYRKKQTVKDTVGNVIQSKNITTTVARKIQEILIKNKTWIGTVGLIFLLLLILMTAVSSCVAMLGNTISAVMAGSYFSEPEEIDAVELSFTEKEMKLQEKIDRIETEYPNYDEYRYNMDSIGHDPFTLISYLSAVHTTFTANSVNSELETLFNEMYILNLEPSTETRIKTIIDSDTGEKSEQEYEVRILQVTLTAIPLENLTERKMDTGQKEIYAAYTETKGGLQQFASPLDLHWYYYVSSYYGYRKNPSTGNINSIMG